MDKAFYVRLHDLTPDSREELMQEVRRRLPEILQNPKHLRSLALALFMAVWNSDKPRNQLLLNQAIADLVFSIPESEKAMDFIEAVNAMILVEWHGIDYWRLSKYIQLVRLQLTAWLKYFRKSKKILNWLILNYVTISGHDQLAGYVINCLCDILRESGPTQETELHPFKVVFRACERVDVQRQLLEKFIMPYGQQKPETRKWTTAFLFAIGKHRDTHQQIRRQVYVIAKYLQSSYQSIYQYAKNQLREEDRVGFDQYGNLCVEDLEREELAETKGKRVKKIGKAKGPSQKGKPKKEKQISENLPGID